MSVEGENVVATVAVECMMKYLNTELYAADGSQTESVQ